jgi:hypothetical protein
MLCDVYGMAQLSHFPGLEVAMTNTDTIFAGSIPALYDKYLGPLIFQPYADDLAKRLSNLNAGRVLETAAAAGSSRARC